MCMVDLKNFFPTANHLLILKNMIRSLRIGKYINAFHSWAVPAVKMAKRMLAENSDGCGQQYHNHTAHALLTQHNIPVQDLGISPVIMLYSRVIKDHLPVLWDKYKIRKQWREICELNEAAMAKRHLQNGHFYNKLRELQIGNSIQIQNQNGP